MNETNEDKPKIRLEAIVGQHYPNATMARIEDHSRGCDNWIYSVTLCDSSSAMTDRIVVRIPRKLSEPNCPVMHSPRFQGLMLTTLTSHGIPVPKLLHESSDYLIESYLGETDLSEVVSNDSKQMTEILSKMGYYVKKMHSIDCCQRFGYIVDFDSNSKKFLGKYETWIAMFAEEWPQNLMGCLSKLLIDEDMFSLLSQLFARVEPYLKSYCEPKLLHSDICGSNARVVFNRRTNSYEFNGLVDWADAMCGDPTYDLGELLISYSADRTVIEMFERGYGKLSQVENRMIVFYAIHYNLWLLNSSVLSQLQDRWLSTLARLTQMTGL